MSIIFTADELRRLKIENLQKLAKYYNIHIGSNWNKTRIIEAIIGGQIPDIPEAPAASTTGVSIRIQRIRDQNKG